jgi:L-amino acid N-acyltransferase YncA
VAAGVKVAGDADVNAITEIYRPIVESTAISFETRAPDRAEMSRRVHDTLRSYPWLVCEIDGVVAGFAYAARHRLREAYQWSVDTSVYVESAYRRRGIGRGLYESLFAILEAQGFFNAYAGIALPNPSSVALHESVGFERIGVFRRVGYKLGRWHDVGWWERALRPHRPSPEKPSDLAAVRRQPNWEILLTCGQRAIREQDSRR